MNPEPDFFLDPTEDGNPNELRACWVKGRLRDAYRDDYMLVNIDPPLPGQRFGLGDKDLKQVLLATRHQGHTLFPITEWPVFVYVIRILDESILLSKNFSSNQVEMILWGILHRSNADVQGRNPKE